MTPGMGTGLDVAGLELAEDRRRRTGGVAGGVPGGVMPLPLARLSPMARTRSRTDTPRSSGGMARAGGGDDSALICLRDAGWEQDIPVAEPLEVGASDRSDMGSVRSESANAFVEVDGVDAGDPNTKGLADPDEPPSGSEVPLPKVNRPCIAAPGPSADRSAPTEAGVVKLYPREREVAALWGHLWPQAPAESSSLSPDCISSDSWCR